MSLVEKADFVSNAGSGSSDWSGNVLGKEERAILNNDGSGRAESRGARQENEDDKVQEGTKQNKPSMTFMDFLKSGVNVVKGKKPMVVEGKAVKMNPDGKPMQVGEGKKNLLANLEGASSKVRVLDQGKMVMGPSANLNKGEKLVGLPMQKGELNAKALKVGADIKVEDHSGALPKGVLVYKEAEGVEVEVDLAIEEPELLGEELVDAELFVSDEDFDELENILEDDSELAIEDDGGVEFEGGQEVIDVQRDDPSVVQNPEPLLERQLSQDEPVEGKSLESLSNEGESSLIKEQPVVQVHNKKRVVLANSTLGVEAEKVSEKTEAKEVVVEGEVVGRDEPVVSAKKVDLSGYRPEARNVRVARSSQSFYQAQVGGSNETVGTGNAFKADEMTFTDHKAGNLTNLLEGLSQEGSEERVAGQGREYSHAGYSGGRGRNQDRGGKHFEDKSEDGNEGALRAMNVTQGQRAAVGSKGFNEVMETVQMSSQGEMVSRIMKEVEKAKESGKSWVRVVLGMSEGKDVAMHINVKDDAVKVRFGTEDEGLEQELKEVWQGLQESAAQRGVVLEGAGFYRSGELLAI